jgi:hypothetical protein
MWIKALNPNTKRLNIKGVSKEPIIFSSKGTANVTEEEGKQLIEMFDSIVEHNSDEDKVKEEFIEDEFTKEEEGDY